MSIFDVRIIKTTPATGLGATVLVNQLNKIISRLRNNYVEYANIILEL